MITFRRMIYLLIAIIVLLGLTIVVLSINYRNTRIGHAQKIGELNHVIARRTVEHQHNLLRVELSDALRQRLYAARKQIDTDIIAMQRELVETLAKNNLIG